MRATRPTHFIILDLITLPNLIIHSHMNVKVQPCLSRTSTAVSSSNRSGAVSYPSTGDQPVCASSLQNESVLQCCDLRTLYSWHMDFLTWDAYSSNPIIITSFMIREVIGYTNTRSSSSVGTCAFRTASHSPTILSLKAKLSIRVLNQVPRHEDVFIA
jgi:hypothetical protein